MVFSATVWHALACKHNRRMYLTSQVNATGFFIVLSHEEKICYIVYDTHVVHISDKQTDSQLTSSDSYKERKSHNVNVNVYGFHCQFQSQRTLQLHPWKAYPESFSTPNSALNMGLIAGA